MLNTASEAIYSATYVDNYIDSVENLPDDVQRQLSRIRDIDVQYRGLLRDVDHYYDLWKSLQNAGDASAPRRARASLRMQQSLIKAQELGDEKMQIVNQLQELIDHKTRQLDTDQKNLDIKEELKDELLQQAAMADECGAPTPPKQSRTQSPARGSELMSTLANGSCTAAAVIGGSMAERLSSNGNIAANKEGNVYTGFAAGSTSSGGGSTPTSERSGNISNGAQAIVSGGAGSNGNGGNINNSNMLANNAASGVADNHRTASKRSRRRNETNNANSSSSGNMELGGNESNSANEAGSNSGGQERNLAQKSNVGATQKNKGAASQNSGIGATAGATSSSTSGAGGNNNSSKKKKRKTRGGGGQSTSAQNVREDTPPPDPIDPDEPTYCVCNQISFGEMILCDNDLCPIEWFHFSCVSLVLKPKGKWYCPNCRGDRPNVMKPKAQFLKELERYNKEKEEKT